MRLFIATPVPDFVVPGLPADTGAPRHLTLKFLGEVPPDRVGDIGRALERALQGAFAFPVTYAGLGAFASAPVDSVLLKKSHLHPSGARHEMLFRVQLPPPPH